MLVTIFERTHIVYFFKVLGFLEFLVLVGRGVVCGSKLVLHIGKRKAN
jgi:hypothetical protein